MLIRIVLLMLVGLATATAGSNALADSAQTESGLTGRVLRGPVTAVCGEDNPCYAPFKGTLVFTPLATGARTTPVRAQSAANGSYRVLLAPMRYRVSTAALTRFGNAVRPSVVIVSKNAVRRVNLIVDTGIRKTQPADPR